MATIDADQEVSNALRAWQERGGMTAARAAQVLGLNLRTYEGWLQGRVPKHLRIIVMLALTALD